jgi:hypothetical protein
MKLKYFTGLNGTEAINIGKIFRIVKSGLWIPEKIVRVRRKIM